MTDMTLGQNICRLRTERGLSQGDLADALDVSRQSVSKWETDASVPELEKLLRLSGLFQVSLANSRFPLAHSATSDCCSATVKALPSPVPCISMISPCSFIMQFRSTCARLSS